MNREAEDRLLRTPAEPLEAPPAPTTALPIAQAEPAAPPATERFPLR